MKYGFSPTGTTMQWNNFFRADKRGVSQSGCP
jgi:hypothetical protein